MTKLSRLIYLAYLYLLSGCSLHQPMSELVIIHQRPTEIDRDVTAVGLSIAASTTEVQPILDIVQKKPINTYDPSEEYISIENTIGNIGLSISHLSSTGSISFTLGLGTIGLDATIALPFLSQSYLTASGSLGGGYQFILQRSILKTYSTTTTLGFNIKRMTHWVNYLDIDPEPNLYGDFGEFQTIDLTSAGIRAMASWKSKNILTLYAGYYTKTRHPVFSLSLGKAVY